jgi:hypothetical protein
MIFTPERVDEWNGLSALSWMSRRMSQGLPNCESVLFYPDVEPFPNHPRQGMQSKVSVGDFSNCGVRVKVSY